MERIKRKNRDGTKNIPGYYKWQFTKEEREKIRDSLMLTETKKQRNLTSQEKIDGFIDHLEFICDGWTSLLDQPHKTVVRSNREQVVSDCKKALEHLKKIERGKEILWHTDTMDSYGAGEKEPDPVGDFIVRSLDEAWAVVGPLEKFVNSLEIYHRSEKKKVGRPIADPDHLVRKIREIYTEHIGKPSASENGPFSRVVRAVLEILGKPHNYPIRAIKAACKK